MTFEDLSKQLNISVQSLQNLVKALSAAFADMEGGSDVVIEPAQESGFLVGNIKVNGENNYLFAPPQPSQPHIYDNSEKLIGVWFHDGISENVYEKTISVSNVNLTVNQMYEIYRDSNIKLFNAYGYLVESNQTYILPESGIRIKEDNHVIYLYGTNGSWINCSGFITIQYTK